MQKTIICPLAFLILWLLSPVRAENKTSDPDKSPTTISEYESLYEQMNLDSLINFKAFEYAYKGYKKLNKNNKSLLTVIDFSLPSSQKRLYVLDLSKKQVLFVSYVSHGKGSGDDYATSFSNRRGSHQSSLGFYRTDETYNGRNGYSLLLDGLEKGINDKARRRSIVIHGADYCSEEVIHSSGRLGRSFGCPALPYELTEPIIDAIKGGSLLFIYADKPDYFAKSKIVKPDAVSKTRL
ncbi:MAG: murein L,D-transpeptidase catalytic domain family protein [Dysgonamonadaceae bacterium]|jgi:hypothetical protein|nr:murein L,D-transpeptidase catalytic domain family protein [Dysgonamonadaceae bacterium]